MKLSGALRASAAFCLVPIEYEAGSMSGMEIYSSIRQYLTVENVSKEGVQEPYTS
jgi:hypothetical protein